jgi:hypothetical protein
MDSVAHNRLGEEPEQSGERSRGVKVFDISAKRRREIEQLAIHVGAADTDDLATYLVAWIWHNPKAQDQAGSVMECARRMGRKGMSPIEAEEIIVEANGTRRRRSADNLARWLGLTWIQRQRLHIDTIGAIDMNKRARKERRRRRDIERKARKRLEAGTPPRSQSLSKLKPWEALKMSRAKWYRLRKSSSPPTSGGETTTATPVFLSTDAVTVSLPVRGEKEVGEEGEDRKKAVPTPAVYVEVTGAAKIAAAKPRYKLKPEHCRKAYLGAHSRLPIELRLQSLGLAA